MTRREAAEDVVGSKWVAMGSAMFLFDSTGVIVAMCAGCGWVIEGGPSGPQTGDEGVNLASDAIVLRYVAREALKASKDTTGRV